MDTERIEESYLLERFRQGDRDALTHLYRTYHPAVYRFALYMTGDPDISAEITQQTFLWLIRHPDAFDHDRGSLGPFLSGVARKMFQRHRRHGLRLVPLSDAAHAEAAEAQTAESARDLRDAIVALPEVYREAIVLCAIEGRSYEEAAAILDCPVGTVRSRVHRAKEQLAQRIAPIGSHAHE